MERMLLRAGACALAVLAAACVSTPQRGDYGAMPGGAQAVAGGGVDDFVLVDCMLPGQIRQLGTMMTYLTPRRPAKTTRKECAMRGGEYIVFDRSDYASALQALLPKARAGDPVAQAYVGEIYEKGLGLPSPNYAESASWYRKAADSGYAPAETSLGSLYERGLGVPKDKAIALDWYRKASGVTEDRLTFESTFQAERDRYQKELALRKRTADGLREKLRSTEERLRRQSQDAKDAQSSLADDRRKLASLKSAGGGAQSQDEINRLRARVQEQEAKLASHDAEVTALKSSYEEQKRVLESQRRDAQSEAERLQKELHAVQEQRDQANARVTSEQQAIDKIRSEVNGLRQELDSAQQRAGAGASTIQSLREQLQARERDLQQSQQRLEASQSKASQLGKLELSRREEYEGVLDAQRRLAGGP
jgi:predicted  nucleic acid-binding Zn-ribbon protein